jgi:hypothetical protein
MERNKVAIVWTAITGSDKCSKLDPLLGNTQSLSRQIVELAEAFDLDGLAELAGALNPRA